jgi:hypothetical protein
MKKALLVLLLLAVAGGLFAQEWSGEVMAQLDAVLQPNASDWSLDWNQAGDYTYGWIGVDFEGGEGTYGGSVGLYMPLFGSVDFDSAMGWFKMFDGKLKVLGGSWKVTDFYVGGATTLSYWNASGIAFNLYPMDGLKLGFGVHDQATFASFDHLHYWVGAAYAAGDLGVYAQFDAAKDKINALFDVKYTFSPFYFALETRFNRLDDFDDGGAGNIALNERFTFTGVDNLTVRLTGTQTFYANKNATGSKDGTAASVNLAVWYNKPLDFIPRVGLSATYNITSEFFNLNPYVLFGLSTSRYLRFDYAARIYFDDGVRNTLSLMFYTSF